MANTPHWLTSIHEAGHAAAAIALGGTASQVSVGENGSGLCYSDVRTATDEVVMVASGPIAQELFGDTPAPSEELDSYEPQASCFLPPSLDDSCRALVAAKDVTVGHEVESDDRRIALWAIKGHEDDPERWSERVNFVKHVARQVVTDHKQEILRIATVLFFRKALFQEEINAAFKGGVEPVTGTQGDS